MKIIFFHGFASGPNSSKVKMLRNEGFDVSAMSIPVDPTEAEAQLIEFIKKELNSAIESGDRESCFVGTSLGGFWAARMAELFDGRAVLINPAMHPEKSLRKYIGENRNYETGETFILTEEVVDSYKNYSAEGNDRYRQYFIATRDPVVEPYIPDSNVRFYGSDDHQGMSFFDDVITYLHKLNGLQNN